MAVATRAANSQLAPSRLRGAERLRRPRQSRIASPRSSTPVATMAPWKGARTNRLSRPVLKLISSTAPQSPKQSERQPMAMVRASKG